MQDKINLNIVKACKSANRKHPIENRVDKLYTRATPEARLHTIKMLLNEFFAKINPSMRNIPVKHASLRIDLQNSRLKIVKAINLLNNLPGLTNDRLYQIQEELINMKSVVEICVTERFLGLRNACFLIEKLYIAMHLAKAVNDTAYNGRSTKFWSTKHYNIDINKFTLYINQIEGEANEYTNEINRIRSTLSRMPGE